jgi:hypothetical protein
VSEGVVSGWTDVSREEVLSELQKVLESAQFRSSKKCTRFFRHIVECVADSRFDCLKERTLGVDVFERDPHYDTNQDPIVRGTAGEVRKRLAQYYVSVGQNDKLRFSLPAGSYVPEVHRIASPSLPVAIAEPLTIRVDSARVGANRTRSNRTYLAVGSTASAVVVACALLAVHFQRTPLERFWAPVLDGYKSILVCIGQPQEYTFHTETARALNSWFAGGLDNETDRERNNERRPPFPSVPIGEIVPLWGNSVALADAQGFARLFNIFAKLGKQADLRGERSVSLSDLRGRPCILIGAFDNEWTLSLAGELRFYFDEDSQRHAQIIRDRRNAKQVGWELVEAWPPTNSIKTDYALVTRVINSTTEKTVVIIAGISQYGTEAAAEFVTNSDYFKQALTNAPHDWNRKNMQVVLSTRVISRTSGPPKVVAVHFW